MEQLKTLQGREVSRPRVNSIFGEGVSPKLRKIRGGLEAAGFPSDLALTHGCPRTMYGVSLATNAREALLGKEKRLKYILAAATSTDATEAIGKHWAVRWLMPRLAHDDIIERIKRHTLINPISHGARVELPQVYDEEPLLYGIGE